MDVHPTAMETEQLLKGCHLETLRRSGPGGQHRNKVETAVRLTHLETGIVGEASERRSQTENRSVALFRLRVQLALKIRTAQNLENIPSKHWQKHLVGKQLKISAANDDFPTLLAEALNALEEVDFAVPVAAKKLKCSSTQLIQLLKLEPAGFQILNTQRQKRGLHPLQ